MRTTLSPNSAVAQTSQGNYRYHAAAIAGGKHGETGGHTVCSDRWKGDKFLLFERDGSPGWQIHIEGSLLVEERADGRFYCETVE